MDFRGIDAKIKRASGQVTALSADIEKFCDGIIKEIAPEIDNNTGEQKWVYRGATPEAPIEWSIRAGEILYNLRSALDHLVWQLVLVNGNTPTKANQFPIVDEERKWQSNQTPKSVKGVAKNDIGIIRSLQPFNPSGCGQFINDTSGFAHLRELCNIDKHRHINLIAAVMENIKHPVRDQIYSPKIPGAKQRKLRLFRGIIQKDMVILKNMVTPNANDTKQYSKLKFHIGVHFHYPDRDTLTPNSVSEKLCDCLTVVRGSRELFRQR